MPAPTRNLTKNALSPAGLFDDEGDYKRLYVRVDNIVNDELLLKTMNTLLILLCIPTLALAVTDCSGDPSLGQCRFMLSKIQ